MDRFWSKVAKSDGCWEWTAGRSPGGYGQFQFRGRPHAAHRVSWMLTNGEIPDGLWVLHSCDNPPCVRPDHLRLGTRQDNGADFAARKRWRSGVIPMRPMPDRGPYTLTEAGKLLGLSANTLRVQLTNGKLRGRKVGKTWTVTERELERYRADHLGRVGRPPK